MKFPFQDVQPADPIRNDGEFEPMPLGDHHVEIVGVKDATNRDGEANGVNVRLRVISGPHEGRNLFDRWYVTAAAAPYTLRKLVAFGIPLPKGGEIELNWTTLGGAEAVALVRKDRRDENRTEVAGYLPTHPGGPTTKPKSKPQLAAVAEDDDLPF